METKKINYAKQKQYGYTRHLEEVVNHNADVLENALNRIKALESLDAYIKQVVKERDIAIGQLNELGYSLGEKIRPCDKGCGGCHYNDGEPHAECVVCNKYVAKEESTLDEVIATIKKQEKWLKQAGYNEYNVSVAFGAIKHILRKRGE